MKGPERYGQRKVSKMYAEINALRQAISAEGTPAIQDAWDKVVQHIEFAYRGCPECRATEAAPGIPDYTREQVRAVANSLAAMRVTTFNVDAAGPAEAMLRAAIGETHDAGR